MQNFSFDVNLKHLNPFTGKVLTIDRMTSDYADQHPFDVDGYLEGVYQKWQDQEDASFRETREAIRQVWNAVLSVKSPSGDASLYPNKDGVHPALMEVWMKAGDYWRAGLRISDRLPDIVPMNKVTRLEDGGWIALFPKDMALLDNEEKLQDMALGCNCDSTGECDGVSADAPSEEEEQAPAPEAEVLHEDKQEEPVIEAPEITADPEQVSVEPEQAVTEPVRPVEQTLFPEIEEPSPVRRTASRKAVEEIFSDPAVEEEERKADIRKKVITVTASLVATLVLVNIFGLFGVAALGLVIGGVVK